MKSNKRSEIQNEFLFGFELDRNLFAEADPGIGGGAQNSMCEHAYTHIMSTKPEGQVTAEVQGPLKGPGSSRGF